MSKNIVAFGASNSKNSINRKLALYAARQVPGSTVNLLDLNDYEMPIYSIDREKESGIPDEAHRFIAEIKAADGVVISFAEHNGAYSVAYKNIYDWVSRVERKIWQDKPMLVMATSPGRRGGKSVFELALQLIRYMNENTIASFSLPSFNKNFSEQEGITDPELAAAFDEQLKLFTGALS